MTKNKITYDLIFSQHFEKFKIFLDSSFSNKPFISDEEDLI